MWWEQEQPQIVRTKKNVLRWYPKAKKLQVARPDWTDENGEIKTGKTVTIDVKEQPQEVRTVFQEVIDSLDKGE